MGTKIGGSHKIDFMHTFLVNVLIEYLSGVGRLNHTPIVTVVLHTRMY